MNSLNDNETFLSMLKEHEGIIYKVANSYCKNLNDRNDLIQEITINLWKSWSRYDSRFSISTWFYRIALNVAISFYRKMYRKSTREEGINENQYFPDTNQDEAVSDNVKSLYYHISQLNELNRALVMLHLDGYNYDEIASTLGISKTNVATKLSRIKEQLKKSFEKN